MLLNPGWANWKPELANCKKNSPLRTEEFFQKMFAHPGMKPCRRPWLHLYAYGTINENIFRGAKFYASFFLVGLDKFSTPCVVLCCVAVWTRLKTVTVVAWISSMTSSIMTRRRVLRLCAVYYRIPPDIRFALGTSTKHRLNIFKTLDAGLRCRW